MKRAQLLVPKLELMTVWILAEFRFRMFGIRSFTVYFLNYMCIHLISRLDLPCDILYLINCKAPFSFKIFVNIVKYKLDLMQKKMETSERDATNRLTI